MKTLIDHLAQYADYHRDRRNILTHFFGVPMIVFAVTVLLSRPSFNVLGFGVSPATLCALATAIFYLRLELRLGALMTALLGLSLWGAANLAAQETMVWLASGVGLFVVGWVIQFIGHHYEGRKPAFVDDLVGLIIGPLFVTVELLFLVGIRDDLRVAIEERSGPTVIRGKDALV